MSNKYWDGTKNVYVIPKHMNVPIKPGYKIGDIIYLDDIIPCYSTRFHSILSLDNHIFPVSAVDMDNFGNIYTATSNNRIRKFDSNGTLIWSIQQHSSGIRCMRINHNGHIVSGGNDFSIRETLPDGTIGWSISSAHSNWVNSLAIDNDGNIVSGGQEGHVAKINNQGHMLWKQEDATGSIRAVSVDSTGNIFSGSADNFLRKYNSDGDIQGQVNTGSFVRDIALNNDNEVFVISSDKIIRKYSPDLSYQGQMIINSLDPIRLRYSGDYLYVVMSNGYIYKTKFQTEPLSILSKYTQSVQDVYVSEEYMVIAFMDGSVKQVDNNVEKIGYKILSVT